MMLIAGKFRRRRLRRSLSPQSSAVPHSRAAPQQYASNERIQLYSSATSLTRTALPSKTRPRSIFSKASFRLLWKSRCIVTGNESTRFHLKIGKTRIPLFPSQSSLATDVQNTQRKRMRLPLPGVGAAQPSHNSLLAPFRVLRKLLKLFSCRLQTFQSNALSLFLKHTTAETTPFQGT